MVERGKIPSQDFRELAHLTERQGELSPLDKLKKHFPVRAVRRLYNGHLKIHARNLHEVELALIRDGSRVKTNLNSSLGKNYVVEGLNTVAANALQGRTLGETEQVSKETLALSEFYQRNSLLMQSVEMASSFYPELGQVNSLQTIVLREALNMAANKGEREAYTAYFADLLLAHTFAPIELDYRRNRYITELGKVYGIALDMLLLGGTEDQKSRIQEALYAKLRASETSTDEKMLICEIIQSGARRFGLRKDVENSRKTAIRWVNGALEAMGLNESTLGVDVQTLIDAWRLSARKEHKDRAKSMDVLMSNFMATIKLELQHPGIVSYFVKECHVMDFARYPSKMLVEQFEQRGNKTQRYITVVFPRDDHNGNFINRKHSLRKLSQDTERLGYLIRIIEAEEAEELQSLAIDQFMQQREYQQTSMLLLAAHSSEESISLGYFPEDSSRGRVTLETVDNGQLDWIRDFLVKNGTCVLWGCNAGQKRGIAQRLQERIKPRKVIGSPIEAIYESTELFVEADGELQARTKYTQKIPIVGRKIKRNGITYQ